MQSIQEAWENYRRDVLPPDASEAELKGFRLAYMSGMWAMFFRLVAMSELDISEADAIRLVEALRQECERFEKDLHEGNA